MSTGIQLYRSHLLEKNSLLKESLIISWTKKRSSIYHANTKKIAWYFLAHSGLIPVEVSGHQ